MFHVDPVHSVLIVLAGKCEMFHPAPFPVGPFVFVRVAATTVHLGLVSQHWRPATRSVPLPSAGFVLYSFSIFFVGYSGRA